MARHVSKKGISPLIATVLIIGFTVALAAIIINWGTGFVRQTQVTTEQSANLQITCAQDVIFAISDACISGTDLVITVSNDGTQDIDEFIARVSNETTSAVGQIIIGGADPFNINSTTVPTADIPNGVSRPSLVELIPRITLEGSQETCSANKFSYGGDSSVALNPCS